MLNLKSEPDQQIQSPASTSESMAAIATTNGMSVAGAASGSAVGGGGRAILHVDPSAAGEGLDELFKAVINGNQHQMTQQVLPMRQRRLPPSFFRPPSAASSTNSVNHSRESSLDGGYQSNGGTAAPLTPSASGANPKSALFSATHNGLQIIHPRANSSPAELQRLTVANGGSGQSVTAFTSADLGKAPPAAAAGATNGPPSTASGGVTHGSHFRTMSYDLDSIRLPEGWEMSFAPTGERYFLNHKDKTTTWEDPRKVVIEEMIRRSTGNLLSPTSSQPPPIIQQSPAHHHHHQLSGDQGQVDQQQQQQLAHIDPCIVPLPDGWEQARTATGDVYFISHNDQTTSWFHPAIPRNLQMKRVQAHQQQAHTAQPPPFNVNLNVNLSIAAAAVAAGGGGGSPLGANIPPELVAALKNMNCQTSLHGGTVTTTTTATSILDQSSAVLFKNDSHSNSSSNNNTPTPHSQQQHLRDLELERERMRQRQEELVKNNLLTASASNLLLSSTAEPAAGGGLGFGSSPFGASLRNECHSRQESADSGLDLGNSSNYSMPHTPDDFLRSVSNGGGGGALGTLGGSLGGSATVNGVGGSLGPLLNGGLSDDLSFESIQLADFDELPDESMDYVMHADTDMLSKVEEILNKNTLETMTWL